MKEILFQNRCIAIDRKLYNVNNSESNTNVGNIDNRKNNDAMKN